MKKTFVLFVMLFSIMLTTYSQSKEIIETVKTVGETTKTVNNVVKIITPADTSYVVNEEVKSETETEIPDSAKLTVKAVYEDFKTGLVGMAMALKTTAEHVYYVLVKQQIVKSIVWLLVGIIGIVMLFSYKKLYNFGHDNCGDSDGASYIPFVLQMIASIVMLILFLGHIHTIVTGFVNPEYGAMNDIIEFISALKSNTPQ